MKRFYRLFILGLLIPVIAFALLEAPFPDVSGTHKNALAIKILKDEGIVKGDGKTGLFKPDRILKRGEFAKMIVEAKKWSVENVVYFVAYPDLQENQWYTKYILKAREMGVFKGTGEGKAEPGRNVLLIEALAMTFRAYGVNIPNPRANEHWYDPILAMARRENILDEATAEEIRIGHVDGKILTLYNGGVPRAEAAQIISNALVRFAGAVVPDVLVPISLTSSAFVEGGAIPRKYSCDGGDVNPPLAISSQAEDVKSFVLIMDDPDAPDPTFMHWVMWNISPDTVEILENNVPQGAVQGQNGFGDKKYGGPCPPPGENHHYYFRLYALDATLDLPVITTRQQLETSLLLNAKVLGQATLIGTYRSQ